MPWFWPVEGPDLTIARTATGAAGPCLEPGTVLLISGEEHPPGEGVQPGALHALRLRSSTAPASGSIAIDEPKAWEDARVALGEALPVQFSSMIPRTAAEPPGSLRVLPASAPAVPRSH